ncbi:unnamed protein product [Gongylonema pulchrum]|uniref:Ricin B-type lectin domain-containing protein n=1 Tax=Gongylonema pulchrum TaxID=637853 RepID=A0A183DVF2_9BILA|nr:unnamed protein product [Gongylonema pulchrum]
MAPCINFLLVKPILRIGQLLFIVTMVTVAPGVGSIGCFVCSSFNGSNPTCEDTFNSTVILEEPNTIGVSNYQYPCWAFKKQRHGLFPADHCIKVNGHRTDDTSQTIVIRTCALDSGTLTADTAIHWHYKAHRNAQILTIQRAHIRVNVFDEYGVRNNSIVVAAGKKNEKHAEEVSRSELTPAEVKPRRAEVEPRRAKPIRTEL